MRTAVTCCALSWLAACRGGPAPASVPIDASGPLDPDLALDRTCRGGADALRAVLPGQVKELVLLWPRVGSRREADACVDVARVTAITHQGVLVTLSLERDAGPNRPELGFRDLVDTEHPRAELDRVPSPDHPAVHVVVAGPPSMDEDQLAAVLEFLDADSLARALDGPG